MCIAQRLRPHREISLHDYDTSKEKLQALDKQCDAILDALKAGTRSSEELLDRTTSLRHHLDDEITGLESTIRTKSDHVGHKIDGLATEFKDLAQRVLEMNKTNLKEAFMDSLFFSDYEIREKSVESPTEETFEWIFDYDGGATPETPAKWPSFPQWLEDTESSKQYWLSGKAGSGKSTLMAHIVRDKRTRNHLKHWSGSQPLHVLSFFLFRPGGKLQCGFEHLLRSLLYQLMKGVPLMQEILMAQFLPARSEARIGTWPTRTLEKMLLLALDVADDHNFLILVDGIDEFQDFKNPRE